MNGPNEQDKFFSQCLNGPLEDLLLWLQERPTFKVIQPDCSTGNTGLHLTALSEDDSRAKSELLIRNGANPWVRNDMSETPSHCAAKSGNLETLKQDGIRESLLEFHRQWYSSNIMSLVLIGKHSLE